LISSKNRLQSYRFAGGFIIELCCDV